MRSKMFVAHYLNALNKVKFSWLWALKALSTFSPPPHARTHAHTTNESIYNCLTLVFIQFNDVRNSVEQALMAVAQCTHRAIDIMAEHREVVM